MLNSDCFWYLHDYNSLNNIIYIYVLQNVPFLFFRPKAKKQKIYGYKEDPFFFMDEANPIWPQVK